MYRPRLVTRAKWFALGFAASTALIASAAMLLAAMEPAEMRYRSVTPTPADRVAPADKPPRFVALAPYADGWKDGVAFDPPREPLISQFDGFGRFEHPIVDQPNNNVPEPGVLALIALPLAWIAWRVKS